MVDYGELHENLVAGGCVNEDVTEVYACGLVLAVVRYGVEGIAPIVRTDIRHSVQTPLRKSRWGCQSGALSGHCGVGETRTSGESRLKIHLGPRRYIQNGCRRTSIQWVRGNRRNLTC